MSRDKSDIDAFLDKIGCKREESFYLSNTGLIYPHVFFTSPAQTNESCATPKNQTLVRNLRKMIIAAIHNYHSSYSFASRAFQLESLLKACNSEQALLNVFGDFLNTHTNGGQDTHHPLVVCFMNQLFSSEHRDILSRLTILIREQAIKNQQEKWKEFELLCPFTGQNCLEKLNVLTQIFKMFSTVNTQEQEGYMMVEFNKV